MRTTFLFTCALTCLTALLPANEIPLASADDAIASQARSIFLEKGAESLPELRKHSRSDNPRLRARANDLLGKITGQYGSAVDLIWNRSLAEAVKASQGEKPILFLHLFGKFDEEFC